VSFRSLGHTGIKTVALGGFDRSCATPVKVLDINTDGKGDVAGRFEDYTPAANAKLSKESWDGVSASLPPGVAQTVLAFPGTFTCDISGVQ